MSPCMQDPFIVSCQKHKITKTLQADKTERIKKYESELKK